MRHWFGTVAAVGFLAVAGVQAGAAESPAARVLTFGDTRRTVTGRSSCAAPRSPRRRRRR